METRIAVPVRCSERYILKRVHRDQQLIARDAWIKKQIAKSKQPNRSHQPSRAAARAITEDMRRFKSPRRDVPHAETTSPTTWFVRGHRSGGRTSINGTDRAFSLEAHQCWISMDRGWNITREAVDNDSGKDSRTALGCRGLCGGERSEDIIIPTACRAQVESCCC